MPEKRLLMGFPYVASALQHSDYILRCAESGVETRLYINFGEGGGLYDHSRDADVGRHSLSLETFRNRRISIYWDPTIVDETFVYDNLFQRGDEEAIINDKLVPFRRLGFFNVAQGTVMLIQQLSRSPPDLDLMIRLNTGLSKSGRPIFISSDRLAMGLREGDTVKVAYVTNYSGEGIRTFYAPSSIFSECLALEVQQEAAEATPYRTIREAVDRLLASIQPGAPGLSARTDRERWERATVRDSMKGAPGEGLLFRSFRRGVPGSARQLCIARLAPGAANLSAKGSQRVTGSPPHYGVGVAQRHLDASEGFGRAYLPKGLHGLQPDLQV